VAELEANEVVIVRAILYDTAGPRQSSALAEDMAIRLGSRAFLLIVVLVVIVLDYG